MENKSSKFKVIIAISIIFLILLALGIYIFISFNSKNKTYITIGYDELLEKVESDERFVLFIGSEMCSHCLTYKNTLNRVIADYNVEIYYIDISSLSESEYAYLNAHYPFTGTPTTIIIENGKEYKRQICRIDGAKNYDHVVEKLKKAEIIKE